MYITSIIKFITLLTFATATPFPQQLQQPQQQQQHQQVQPQQQQQETNHNQQQLKLQTNLPPTKQTNANNGQNEYVDQAPAAASSPSISYLDKDGNTNVLENPSYNPDIYSSFIPQDAIQQYLNYFGGPVPYTAGILPPPTPLSVQTGYEGYIVPVQQQQQNDPEPVVWTFLKSIIPNIIFAWIIKFAAIAASAVGIVLFGGALTTAICAFTPLCSISFTAAFPAIGRSLENDSNFSRIKRVAEFLQNAIEKYDELQRIDKSASVKNFLHNNY